MLIIHKKNSAQLIWSSYEKLAFIEVSSFRNWIYKFNWKILQFHLGSKGHTVSLIQNKQDELRLFKMRVSNTVKGFSGGEQKGVEM